MKIVIANWKMYLTVRESLALTRGILRGIRGKIKLPEIVLCPSFTAIGEMRKILARSKVQLGAQNVFWEDSGAHTGEVSIRQLAESKVSHVILGHSERRAMGETDEMVNKKIQAVMEARMIPVVCLGEPAGVRKKGEEAAAEFVREQLKDTLNGVRFGTKPFFIAYEPIWSISSSFVKQATSGEVVAMHEVIRSELDKVYGHDATANVHIIYGGSINKGNAYTFLREPAIEGVLVGSASTRLSEFNEIIKAAAETI